MLFFNFQFEQAPGCVSNSGISILLANKFFGIYAFNLNLKLLLKNRTGYHSFNETLGLTPLQSAVFNLAFITLFSHHKPCQTLLVSLLK